MVSRQYNAIKNRKRYARPEQVQALIDHFFDKGGRTSWIDLANKRKAMLIYTLWRTGRRVSEIVGDKENVRRVHGLRPMDIDREDRTITFSILKKNPVRSKDKQGKLRSEELVMKERFKKEVYAEDIAYDDEFFDALVGFVDALSIPDHERIFPYTRQYVDQFLKKGAGSLGLHLGYRKVIGEDGRALTERMPFNVHSLRHGFSMHFLKNNKGDPNALPMLQEILCHSSIVVTKTYLKYDQEDRRKALNKVFG